MRKFHEIKLLLASRGMAEFPVIGNVYLLTRGVAKLFNSGKLAGCVVSDELLAQCEKYAAGPDKGQAFFRELAAKQLAVFRGLGFAAGYLGGIAKLETFGQIIDLAESYAADDWREFIKEIQFSQPDEFFLFEHDPQTGLASPDRFNPQFIASLARPPKSKEVTLNYRLSRFVHRPGLHARPGDSRFDAAALSALGPEARASAAGWFIRWKERRNTPCTDARTAATAACRSAPIFARATPAPSAAATAPAAVRPMVAASWTTRSVSGHAFTSD